MELCCERFADSKKLAMQKGPRFCDVNGKMKNDSRTLNIQTFSLHFNKKNSRRDKNMQYQTINKCHFEQRDTTSSK